MTNLDSLLQDAGLTPTEIAIYRAGLARPATLASALAHATRIKRPTVYHALETLMQKGLAAKKKIGGGVAFTMSPPERLERLIDVQIDSLQKKREQIRKLAPQLAFKEDTVAGMEVSHFSGSEGVKAVVEEALYCKTRRWDIIAPTKNFFSEFSADYARYFMQARASRGIIARSLWERSFAPRVMTEDVLQARNPRLLPKALEGRFTSVIILFDDAAAIIPPKATSAALLVRSKNVHDTLSAMFEGLWLSAEPFRPKTKTPR